ncbi:MAG: preprotein translocase subunit SecG [Bryobacteraceae bacterium]
MQHVVIVVHLMIVLALIGTVLLQRSEGGGLGIGGGGGFMTSRGTANVLTRATAILAGLFFVTSLILSILAGINRKPTSILPGGGGGPVPVQTPGEVPPLGGGGGGLLKQLEQGAPGSQTPAAPATPAAPSGPQVPQSR